ncbi:hypothetical protein AD998_05215 [bacterium 336/3]|nr:hypothetical protein AD998_05215 [bacterium 336/3]
MKSIFLFLALWMRHSAFAQNTEFNILGNGLIYSDETIKPLKKIVDSLNLKFKVCELNQTYLSQMQGKAHYISLSGNNANKAKLDLDNKISFDDFIKKYKKAEIHKELLIVRYSYIDYDKKNVTTFNSIGVEDYTIHTHDKQNNPLKNKWIYNYSEKSEYSEASLNAFYFIEEFSNQPIPEKYARMIQYSNCMIDTTTQIFDEKLDKHYGYQENSNIFKFLDYLHNATNRPKYEDYNDENYDTYLKNYRIWDSLRISKIDKLKKTDKKFDILFQDALKEALEKGGCDDEFEEYVGRYHSKKVELELKRGRRVVGGCSQDDSPRVHALNIAKLSAETAYWKIFLRAHLDIMNDRFERVTDGSYAWAGRQTYIKELEVLDIDVKNLLLGITFRMENANKNHYYGDVGRLGRALSESREAKAIETKILEIIADKELDDYNRVIMCYLFLNYNHYIEDVKRKQENKERLDIALKTLPKYLSKEMALLNK